jgi:hypothetical protein
MGGEVATKAQISAAIRERVDRGVDVVKVMGRVAARTRQEPT